jgi:hypothetical protein
MNCLIANLYENLANEIIDINKGNLRTKRKCLTLNYLKSYHANVIENRPLLKFKFVFRSRIKRKRKRISFFKRKYFIIKKFKKFSYSNTIKKFIKKKNLKSSIIKTNKNSFNDKIYRNLLKKFN